ncbi:MAG: SDR family NAD(P)-dependent oxidoreductase [Clostridiales bacterium]|nr:SDR family NAD(P)-dependent oxidoreductase [Clostridiales bacterium]
MKKTVWVTGASSGLGMATAKAFAAAGWRVIGGARSFADAAPEATEDLYRLPLDVTSPESCESFAKKALEISPRVDAIVCAAAVLVLGSCENTSCEEYSRVLETNFVGTVRMVQHALPLMRQQMSGRIILFSSINGLLGIPFQSAYTASKHAMEGYAECLAMETRRFGVQVCLVEPGDHRGGSNHTRLHAAQEGTDSAYQAAYESACTVIHRDESGGLSPEALGQKVVRNAQRKHMRFRLRVAKFDQHLAVWLHRYLPNWVNSLILRNYYGADKANH